MVDLTPTSADANCTEGTQAEPSGWLIEHSGAVAGHQGSISWLCVKLQFEGFGKREFGYTHDASHALRFARKEDAEAVLKMHLGASPPDWYSMPFSVTEHCWPESGIDPLTAAYAEGRKDEASERAWIPVARDAARYRWLNSPEGEWEPFDSAWLVKADLYGQNPADMDAYIDEAIQSQCADSRTAPAETTGSDQPSEDRP